MQVRAIVLSIGSELLAGDTVDTNAAFLARGLARLGVELATVRQLPDDRSVIAAAVSEARGAASLVIATGGLGPTHDDLSREAVAQALGEELTSDPELETMLHERFGGIGRMPSTNLRQAMRIPSAQIVANPIGSAPGWWVDRDDVVLALLPGVPSEMRRMFDGELTPRLVARFSPTPPAVRTVKTFGVGESAVAELVGNLLTEPGDGVTAGIYARDDGVHLRFRAAAGDADLEPLVARAREALGEAVWGVDDGDLAGIALAALGRSGIATLSSWEADSGGALLALLSAAPVAAGAARYLGGVLDAGGSPHTPMAEACLQLSLLPQDRRGRSRVRVAVSGGLNVAISELRIHGSGDQRRRRAAYAALDLVRRAIPAEG